LYCLPYSTQFTPLLSRFQNLFSSVIIFLLGTVFITNKKQIKLLFYSFYIGFIINSIFQTLLYLVPNFFFFIGNQLINIGYLNLIQMNIGRNRIYFESYDEILIPFFVYYSQINSRLKKTLSFISIFIIGFFSYTLGVRTKIVMFFFGLLGSFFVFKLGSKRIILLILCCFVLFQNLYDQHIISGNVNVFNRINDQDATIQTYTSGRLSRWLDSVDMGLSKPFFGIGLGNYYDYLRYSDKNERYLLFSFERVGYELAATHPHNIFFATFAETGFVGLFCFSILLFYGAITQAKLWGNEMYTINQKIAVISFWTLFIYSLFNPSITIKFQALMLLLLSISTRLIYPTSKQKSKNNILLKMTK